MSLVSSQALRKVSYEGMLDYLLFEPNEYGHPARDREGNRILRKEVLLSGVQCSPWSFAAECLGINRKYGKNTKEGEVKAYLYILSYTPEDADRGLTTQLAQKLALELIRTCLPGHQALVCTHSDGRKHRGNIHTHVYLNSVRKLPVPPEQRTEREGDRKAGNKHRETPAFRKFMADRFVELCRREGLTVPPPGAARTKSLTVREIMQMEAGQRRLDEKNRQLLLAERTPDQVRYRTEFQKIREAVAEVSKYAWTGEEFREEMMTKHSVYVGEYKGGWSYLTPEMKVFVPDDRLGEAYTKTFLEGVFRENRREEAARREGPAYSEDERLSLRKVQAVSRLSSELPLVRDLREKLKGEPLDAPAPEKLRTLHRMAEAVLAVERNGFETLEEMTEAYRQLEERSVELGREVEKMRRDPPDPELAERLRSTEEELEKVRQRRDELGMIRRTVREILGTEIPAPQKEKEEPGPERKRREEPAL